MQVLTSSEIWASSELVISFNGLRDYNCNLRCFKNSAPFADFKRFSVEIAKINYGNAIVSSRWTCHFLSSKAVYFQFQWSITCDSCCQVLILSAVMKLHVSGVFTFFSCWCTNLPHAVEAREFEGCSISMTRNISTVEGKLRVLKWLIQLIWTMVSCQVVRFYCGFFYLSVFAWLLLWHSSNHMFLEIFEKFVYFSSFFLLTS